MMEMEIVYNVILTAEAKFVDSLMIAEVYV